MPSDIFKRATAPYSLGGYQRPCGGTIVVGEPAAVGYLSGFYVAKPQRPWTVEGVKQMHAEEQEATALQADKDRALHETAKQQYAQCMEEQSRALEDAVALEKAFHEKERAAALEFSMPRAGYPYTSPYYTHNTGSVGYPFNSTGRAAPQAGSAAYSAYLGSHRYGAHSGVRY